VIDVFVAGIGLHGPGMPDWAAGVATLTGQRKLAWDAPPLPPPALLAPNERRRAGTVVRLALAVAQQASDMAGAPPGSLRSVFASANGDGAIIHAILETLAGTERQVSPTQFHNSVHNAPAGYWSIGARSRAAACTLGCYDFTAAAALLKAGAEAQTESEPVLLCLYDAPLPEPLARSRPTAHVFGAALVLVPHACARPLARLRLAWRAHPADEAAGMPRQDELRGLACANPAARVLPLLEAVACRERRRVSLALLDGRIDVDVEPCWTDPASLR